MPAPLGLPSTVGLPIPREGVTAVKVPSLRDGATEQAGATPFAERLKDFVGEVNETQKVGEQMAEDFANGKQNDIHGTMIAMQKADVTLRLLGSVRNRAIEAYREIMRMGA